MSKKMYNLIQGCVGGVATISTAFVTFFKPQYATAIVAAIGVVATASIEVCGLFVKQDTIEE